MVLSLRYPPAGPGRAGSEFDFLDIILATAALRAAGQPLIEFQTYVKKESDKSTNFIFSHCRKGCCKERNIENCQFLKDCTVGGT